MALTLKDLTEIGSEAAARYVEQPVRPRFDGAHRDLTEPERRLAAVYDAVVSNLRRKGLLGDEILDHLPRYRR